MPDPWLQNYPEWLGSESKYFLYSGILFFEHKPEDVKDKC